MNNHMLNVMYETPEESAAVQRRMLTVLVDNEFGVLARVIGFFAGRGYNIESLTVAEVEHDKKRSRITMVTSATEPVLEQIKRLLEKMVPVHKVTDLTEKGAHIERELALVKIHDNDENRAKAIKIADLFAARIIDSSPEVLIFELTGGSKKIDEFIELLCPFGVTEISRTGITAMSRGKQSL